MAAAEVSIEGVDVFRRSIEGAAGRFEDLTEVHRESGAEVLRGARIPRATGALERSAYVDASPAGFALTATAPYAGIVHARDPFFTRAVDNGADLIVAALADHAETVLATIEGA